MEHSNQFKINASARLLATSSKVMAKEDVQVSEWWHHLPAEQKEEYLSQHPNSKYADQAIQEKQGQEEQGHEIPETLKPGSPQRKELGQAITKSSSKIAATLRKTFPKIHVAGAALKHLASGKKLDHEHKETLHELGGLALKTALSHAVGPHAAKALGHVGVTAVNHAIEKFKEYKHKSKKSDDVETFVDAVADGVEKAEAAPIPQEHQKPKSSYRSAIAKHVRNASAHTVEVLNKSFKDIKPATAGLASLATGKPIDKNQKQAVKNLGKVALATSIATLPGGLAAHLAAGLGAAALTHAYRAIRNSGNGGNILHRFVDSIGEGLEDAILEHAAGEGHGGE
jgi:hypothetical protein